MNWRPASIAAAGLLLFACAGQAPRPPAEEVDGAPEGVLDPARVRDAVPAPEPRSRYGNHSPYTVLGRTYTVLDSATGYRERGLASWYGRKFHGRRTSSGEPFDMYAATAAHRRLPLPTYAEVTNLDNGRRIIVKINDRGPFHSERLIDLSYGAAVRLGMVGVGTAPVEVRAITFDEPRTLASAGAGKATYLQAGAFGERRAAEALAEVLGREQVEPVSIQSSGGLHKVWIGPYLHDTELESVISRVVELGFERPHRVRP